MLANSSPAFYDYIPQCNEHDLGLLCLMPGSGLLVLSFHGLAPNSTAFDSRYINFCYLVAECTWSVMPSTLERTYELSVRHMCYTYCFAIFSHTIDILQDEVTHVTTPTTSHWYS